MSEDNHFWFVIGMALMWWFYTVVNLWIHYKELCNYCKWLKEPREAKA